MSRIESGRMTVKNEEFSFAKTVAQVNTIISGQCTDGSSGNLCEAGGPPYRCVSMYSRIYPSPWR